MYQKLEVNKLLDLTQTISGNIFSKSVYPWEIISNIGNFIIEIGKGLSSSEYKIIKENIWISNDSYIDSSASINGPAIIQSGVEVRHCAFIRGNTIVGKNSVVGNSTELKNVILFNNVQVPHYNYVGDSILGYKTHLGAGSITSNVKSDRSFVTISFENQKIQTKLKKFGAIIGDYSEIGCNTVLNPGTIVGRNTSIYPLTMVRGYIESESILKGNGEIVSKIY